MTSLSDLPLGSKSEPPLPPPIGSVVSEFLRICSKARNFRMPRFTVGWKRRPPLYGPMALLNSMRIAAVDLDVALVVQPRHAEHDHPLGLAEPLEDPVLLVLGVPLEDRLERLEHLLDRLMELRLPRVALDHQFQNVSERRT